MSDVKPRTRNRAVLHIPAEVPGSENLPALTETEEQYDDEPQSDADRVAEMLRTVGTEGKSTVRVFKIKDGQSVYCKSYAPSDFEDGDYDMLRAAFGPGRYKIMVYGPIPNSNKMGLRGRAEVQIAEDYSASAAPVAGLPGVSADSGLARVLQSIAEGQQRMMETIMAQQNQPPKNPMDDLKSMLGVMSLMREAMGLGAANQQKSSIGEIVEAVRELRGVASEIVPEKDGEGDGMMSALGQLVPLIREGIQAQREQAAAPQSMPGVVIPPTLAAPTPSAQPSPSNQPTGDDEVNPIQAVLLKNKIAKFMAMAASNADVEESAMFAYDELPDEMIEILLQAEWFDMLKMLEPGAAPHQEWLTRVRNRCVQFLVEDGVIDQASAPADALAGWTLPAAPDAGQSEPVDKPPAA
jgi:hypothetical protein